MYIYLYPVDIHCIISTAQTDISYTLKDITFFLKINALSTFSGINHSNVVLFKNDGYMVICVYKLNFNNPLHSNPEI